LRVVREDLSGAAERGAAMTTASLMEYLTTLDAQPAHRASLSRSLRPAAGP
jgi:hypothetical protein